MNRSTKIVSLGVGNANSVASPPNNRAEQLRDKREKQEAYRQKLEYDAMNSIPEDRRPYQRKVPENFKVGLSIGHAQTDSEKSASKKAKQEAYRKMLDDTKDLAPITGDRKRFERRSPPSSDQMAAAELGIGERTEEFMEIKRQDAIEYRKQLERDMTLKKEKQAELDYYDKSKMGGLMIGKEEPKSPSKATARTQVAVNNIFPSADDGADAANPRNQRNRAQQDAKVAPAPAEDVQWGQRVAPKGQGQEEAKYINHSGLTGLCVGSEGDSEQKRADKSSRVERYRSQLASDMKTKAAARDNELASHRYLS